MLLPLQFLQRGESAVIAQITGDEHWQCRLAELGLRPGTRLLMLQPGSPCLCQLGNTRLSLRLEEEVHILVEVLAEAPASEVA